MKTEEGRLKDQIKAILKVRGAYIFMPVQHGYGKKSIDFLCCMPYQHVVSLAPYKTERRSRFLGIETKAPGKKPTPLQEIAMREIVAAGGAAFWCDSYSDSYSGFLTNMVLWGFIEASVGVTPLPQTEAGSRSRSRPRSPQ